jgi:DNA repair exonuclease SbcCD nuclease subunit
MVIQKELHKERQGSIAVDKTSIEVKKRIEHPKFNEKSIVPKVQEVKPVVESEKQDKPRIEEFIQRDETVKEGMLPNQSISSTLKAFEKEMLTRQKGYAELAKEKINDALANRLQYIKEFHTFLNKGMGVSDALNKFSERYANNPYIKGIIETSITGELQLQALKDKGIEELTHHIKILNSEIQGLKQNLDVRETEIASFNQKMESLVVAHTKQLEGIEINLGEFIEKREELIKDKHNPTSSSKISKSHILGLLSNTK